MGLWKFFRDLGIGLKLTGMVTFGMVALLIAAVVIGFINAENLTTQAGRGRAAQEAEVIQGRLKKAEQEVLASAEFLAGKTGWDEAVGSGDATRVSMLIFSFLLSPLDLDEIGVIDSDGAYITKVIGRIGARGSEGAYVTTVMGEALGSAEDDAMVQYALRGIETTGIVVGDAAPGPSIVTVVPLRNESGRIVGALSASRRIDDGFLEERNFYRDDVHVALIADGQILAQDFPSPEIPGELSGALIEEPHYESRDSGETVVADDLLRSSDGIPYALAHFPFGPYALAYSSFTKEATPIVGEDDSIAEVGASIAIAVDMSELNVFERRLMSTTAIVLASLTLVVALTVALFARGGITRPIGRLRFASERMASGDYQQVAEVGTKDEVGQLANAFNTMSAQLQQTLESLERRTGELQRRSAQLQASSAVGRAVASVLETEQLVRGVVDLIREQFDLYYVGLFLVDATGEWALLQAGTGEAGQAMLARGHRIRVGEGMIGWSIVHAQARVAEEVGVDAVRLATEELPDTRSEAALALRSRGQVLGALTVQSVQPGAFDEQTLTVLQTMADQVAVAIDNARLYVESQAALEAERRAYGELSRAAWAEYLRERPGLGFYCDGSVVTSVSERVQDSQELPAFSVPVTLRGQVIGTIDARKPDDAQAWTEDEAQLLGALAEQLGQALESARLYQDTQRRAAHERLVGDIADRLQRAPDMEMLLQAAAQELNRALGGSRVYVRLGVSGRKNEPDDNGGSGST